MVLSLLPPAGIPDNLVGGMGTVPRNAYLPHVTMGWICLSSVCEASRPIYDEKTAPVSVSTKCFVVVCSNKF